MRGLLIIVRGVKNPFNESVTPLLTDSVRALLTPPLLHHWTSCMWKTGALVCFPPRLLTRESPMFIAGSSFSEILVTAAPYPCTSIAQYKS